MRAAPQSHRPLDASRQPEAGEQDILAEADGDVDVNLSASRWLKILLTMYECVWRWRYRRLGNLLDAHIGRRNKQVACYGGLGVIENHGDRWRSGYLPVRQARELEILA